MLFRSPAPSGRVRADLEFPVEGTLVLRVGSAAGSGHYALRVRLRPRPEGTTPARSDLREAGDRTALLGDWSLLAANRGGVAGPFPSLLAGAVEFRGRGRVRTDLRSVVPGPSGGGIAAPTQIPGTRGTWFSDGERAAVGLDLGAGRVLDLDAGLAGGGEILHAGLGDPEATLVALLTRQGPPLTASGLSGTWGYFAVDGDGTAPAYEVGTLTLNAAEIGRAHV